MWNEMNVVQVQPALMQRSLPVHSGARRVGVMGGLFVAMFDSSVSLRCRKLTITTFSTIVSADVSVR